MIEINLLPDVKQEFIRAQRLRNTVISISILVGLAAVGIVLLLGSFLGTQVIRDKLAGDAIDKEFKKLSEVDDISKIVTIKNRLAKISDINQNRSISSRIFDVLTAINPQEPNDVKMSSVTYDPEDRTISVEGSAKNGYAATDVFKKTILNTKFEYVDGEKTETVPLTSDVTISNTSYGEDNTGARVLRFSLSFKYYKDLFSNEINNARIISPTGKIDVTDSRVRVPDSLFSQRANDTDASNGEGQ